MSGYFNRLKGELANYRKKKLYERKIEKLFQGAADRRKKPR